VPAVLGVELAAGAASDLLPDHTVFGLRDVALKKAERLIFDRPGVLLAEVRAASQEAAAAGADLLVHAALTATA
jgi:hypothetical protein